MTTAMRQVADLLGVAVTDARLLRLTNNAVFALPAARLAIPITRSHGLRDRVHKVVRLAGWFERVNAPTIRLAPAIDQPVLAGDLLATVWRYVHPTPPALTLDDLGLVLRQFHALGVPTFSLRSRSAKRGSVAPAHRALAAAYGYDVTSDPDWPLLREARELKMVAAGVPLLASAPGVAEEFAVRLGSVARGDDNTRSTPFADLPQRRLGKS